MSKLKVTSTTALATASEPLKISGSHQEREDRAQRLATMFIGEMIPLLVQVRQDFMDKERAETICGVKTFTEYCTGVLRYSESHVRNLIKGQNPASDKHDGSAKRKPLPPAAPIAVQPEPTQPIIDAEFGDASQPAETPQPAAAPLTVKELLDWFEAGETDDFNQFLILSRRGGLAGKVSLSFSALEPAIAKMLAEYYLELKKNPPTEIEMRPSVDAKQCTAICKSGRQCSNWHVEDGDLCPTHMRATPPTPPAEEPEPAAMPFVKHLLRGHIAGLPLKDTLREMMCGATKRSRYVLDAENATCTQCLSAAPQPPAEKATPAAPVDYSTMTLAEIQASPEYAAYKNDGSEMPPEMTARYSAELNRLLTCTATTKKGTPCQNMNSIEDGLCPTHHPERISERKASEKKWKFRHDFERAYDDLLDDIESPDCALDDEKPIQGHKPTPEEKRTAFKQTCKKFNLSAEAGLQIMDDLYTSLEEMAILREPPTEPQPAEAPQPAEEMVQP